MLPELQKLSDAPHFTYTFPNEPESRRHWFRASQVCRLLYGKSANAYRYLAQHCKDWQYREIQAGKGRPALYVCESGLYRLILQSKAPIALEFQDWLTEEVLPKLRASGGYIMPSATSDQIQGLQRELAAMTQRAGTLAIANRGFHLYDQVAYYFSVREIIPQKQQAKLRQDFIRWARQEKGVWIEKTRTLASEPEGTPTLLDRKADWLITALLDFWKARKDWGRVLMTADYYGLV